MSRFYSLLIKTFLFITCLFSFQAISYSAGNPWDNGDVHDGAVPSFVQFYGRINRDGTPYTGTAEIAMRIYTATDTAHTYSACYCSSHDCNSVIPNNVRGCLWQSGKYSVEAVNGLFKTEISIPLSVLSVAGPDSKKYYEIVSYLSDDEYYPVTSGTNDTGYASFDSTVYTYAAKAVEENSVLVLSTLSVSQQGNLYLSQSPGGSGGKIYFHNTYAKTVEGTVVTPGTSFLDQAQVSGEINVIENTGYVFVNSKNQISFYTTNGGGHSESDVRYSTPTLYMSADNRVGLGTSSPEHVLHVANRDYPGLNANMMVGRLNAYNGADSLKMAGVRVSTITNSYNDGNSGAIFLNNSDIRMKIVSNSAKTPIYIKGNPAKTVINYDAGTSSYSQNFVVNGDVFAADSVLAGDVLVQNNEINSYDGNSLYLQPTGSGNFKIGPAEFPNGGKLQVVGGIKAESITISTNTILASNGPSGGATVFNGESIAVDTVQTKLVELSTTVIYGKLDVRGNSSISNPAYTNQPNTFYNNTYFKDIINIGSNSNFIAKHSLVVSGGAFEDPRIISKPGYLQIGDSASSYSDKDTFLAVNSANSGQGKLQIYRGGTSNSKLAAEIYSTSINDLNINAGGPNLYFDKDIHSLNSGHFSADEGLNAYTNYKSGGNLIYFGTMPSTFTRSSSGEVAAVNGILSVSSIKFAGDGSSIDSSALNENPQDITATNALTIRSYSSMIRLQNNASNAVVISSYGKVGIGGKVNPSQTLDISGSLLAGNSSISGSEVKLKADSIYSTTGLKAASGGIYVNGNQIINNSGVFAHSIWNGNVIDVSHGGTGLTTSNYTAGKVLKGNGTNPVNVEKLKLGSSAGEITDILAVTNGGIGTAITAPTSGQSGMLAYDSVSEVPVISRRKIKMNTETTGVLKVNAGGSGQNISGLTGIMRSYGVATGTGTLNLDSDEEVSGYLKVENGGFGNLNISNKPFIIYASESKKLATLELTPGNPVIGRPSTYPVAMSDSSWGLTNMNREVNLASPASIAAGQASTMTFSIPQSVDPSATPEFGGLKFSSPVLVNGILEIRNSEGAISTATIDIAEKITNTMGLINGGTGTNTLPAGPVRANSESLQSGATQYLDLTSEVDNKLAISHGGTNLNTSDLNTGNMIVASGSNVLSAVSFSDGELLIGRNGQIPLASGITTNANRPLRIINGAGSINIEAHQNIRSSASPTFANLTLKNLNGFIKANNSSPLTGQGTINLASETDGVLSLANGGLGNGGITGSGMLYSNGSSSYISSISIADAANISGLLAYAHGGLNHDFTSDSNGIIRASAGSAAVSQVNLNQSSGDFDSGTVLEFDNGGTGVSSIPSGAVVHSNGSIIDNTAVKVQLDSSEIDGILSIANGGLGRNDFKENRLLYANSSGKISHLNLPKGSFAIKSSTVATGRFYVGNSFSVNTDTDKEIKLSFKQSMTETATPTFGGLKIRHKGGILHADADGLVSTHTLFLDDYLSSLGTVSVDHGGTGLSTMTEGPIVNNSGVLSVGTLDLENHVENYLPVAYGGLGELTLNQNSLLLASSDGLVSGQIGSGKLLIGNASSVPSSANLSKTANQTTVTSGNGYIIIGAAQDIAQTSMPVFAGLKITGQNGYVKATGGTVSFVSKINISESDGILTAEHGGIGHNSPNPGIAGVYYDNTAGGNVVSGRNLYLNGDVSGKLPVSKGGLGTSFAANRNGILIKDSGSDFYLGPIDISTHTQNTLTVSHGGTGKTSFASDQVLITGTGGSNIITLPLKDKKVLGGNRNSAPDNITIANGSEGDGLVMTSNEAADKKSVFINFSLQQPLSSTSNVTFNALTLNGFEDSTGLKYLKKDGYIKSSEIDLTNDVNGIMQVSKGGLGKANPGTGVLYADETSGSVGTISLAPILGAPTVVFGTDDGPVPAAISFGTGLSSNVSNDGNGNYTLTFALDRDTVTANGITAVSTPTFGGLSLGASSLANAPLLKYAGSSTFMQKYDTTLPVSKGGTGISAVPASGNYLATTDGSGNWQAVNQFESWKVFMGNSGSTAMEAVSLKGSNGIVVSTETVDGNTSISIGLPQDLSEASTTAEFANVNISGDVTATTLKAGAVKVPVVDGCKFDDSGTVGQMKFCKTRTKYKCSGIKGTRCIENGQVKCDYTSACLTASAASSENVTFNQLVYKTSEGWRCSSDGQLIGLIGTDCEDSNH